MPTVQTKSSDEPTVVIYDDVDQAIGIGPGCCCEPTDEGACCHDGGCTITNAADCADSGGTYQGDDTDCGSVDCGTATSGACCNGEVCSITAPDDCSGTYEGDNSTCDPNPCSSLPGCCGNAFSYGGSFWLTKIIPTHGATGPPCTLPFTCQVSSGECEDEVISIDPDSCEVTTTYVPNGIHWTIKNQRATPFEFPCDVYSDGCTDDYQGCYSDPPIYSDECTPV